MAGRSTKLTPQNAERITNAIAKGLTLETAATLAGIHKTTLHRWIARGRTASRGMYREFFDDVEIATAEFERVHLDLVEKSAREGGVETHEELIKLPGGEERRVVKRITRPDVASSKWLLARRFPDRYSERVVTDQRHRVSGSLTGAPRKIEVAFITPTPPGGEDGEAEAGDTPPESEPEPGA